MAEDSDFCVWFDDHVPKMGNDPPWNHRGRAYAYATGSRIELLQAVNALNVNVNVNASA